MGCVNVQMSVVPEVKGTPCTGSFVLGSLSTQSSHRFTGLSHHTFRIQLALLESSVWKEQKALRATREITSQEPGDDRAASKSGHSLKILLELCCDVIHHNTIDMFAS